MKKSKFSESQIVNILKEVEGGVSLEDLIRRESKKKTPEVEERRELAKCAVDEHGLSARRACRTVTLNRRTYRYQARKTDDQQIEQELRQLAERQPR